MLRTFLLFSGIITIGLVGSSSFLLTANAYNPTPQTVYRGGVHVQPNAQTRGNNWWTMTPSKRWEQPWEAPFYKSKKKTKRNIWNRGLLHIPQSSGWSLTP